MHLVFLNQYYPPDAAPTGVMLAAVAEELAAQGHEVTVICAEGGYANIERRTSNVELRTSKGRDAFTHASGLSPRACGEMGTAEERDDPPGGGRPAADEVGRLRKGGPTIVRIGATRFGRGTFLGKVVDYLSYYVGVAWKLMFLKPRPERIVALTTPPYLSVLARVFSKLRGGDHAHWVMDLYPDVMVAHGMLREGSLPHRVLAGLARWGFGGRRCAALLTLGPDMAEHLEKLVGTDLSIGPTCPQRGGSIFSWAFRFTEAHGRHSADEWDGCVNPSLTGKSVGHLRKDAPTWIPLWSDAAEEHRTSNVEHRTLKDEGHLSSLIDDSRSLRRARGWRDDELVVMYSGNMGLGHRFGEILEVIGKDGFKHPSHWSPSARGENEVAGDRRSEMTGRDGFTHPSHLSPAARGENEKVAGCRGAGEEEDPAGAGRPAADEVGHLRKDAPTGVEAGHLPSTIHNPRSPVRFVFFGGGKRRGEIETFVAEHPEAAVELHDYAPSAELSSHLRSADVHLASLAAEWTGTMVPSKLQGIFHAARPVIFIGDATSSIGKWVAESGGGWLVAPGDVEGLERAIDEARDPQVRESRGGAAKAFAEANFDKTINVRRVAEVLGNALV